MKAPIYNKKGNKKGEVVLNPAIYAARINHRLIELARNAFAANLRHGTADTKVRKEVQGGGKKPWKQKGTGRARHGSIRSPIWVGGGTVFGPHPRSYYVPMPKQMRKQALIAALSLRGSEKNVLLLEDAQMMTAKTKEWAEVINALPLNGKRTLCIVNELSENLKRASRNLNYKVEVLSAKDVNAYDVLQRPKLLIEQDAVSAIEERLSSGTEARLPSESAEGEPKAAPKKPRKRVTAKKKPVKKAKKKL